MPTEICRRCGGSGSNGNVKKPGACSLCFGKGTVDYQVIVKGYERKIIHFQDEIEIRRQAIRDLAGQETITETE